MELVLMRALCASVLVLIVTPPVSSQPETALGVIQQCAQTVDEEAVGVDDLEADCPGLRAALDELQVTQWLSDMQREELTPASLSDLARLDERYRTPPGASVDPAALAPILASLDEQSTATPTGLMERIKQWLRSLIERQMTDGSWLERWLTNFDVSRGTMLAVMYGLAILVIASALGIIFNELRVAGVFGGKHRRASKGQPGAMSMAAAPLTLADIDTAPLHERPSLLLRLLLASLARTGRIRAERSLTHRELVAHASFDDTNQRESFARVASAAEAILYGGRSLDSRELESVLEGGCALQRELERPP
jgi:hypothetical protein